MDPLTWLFVLAAANIVLEKGVLPAKRLHQGLVTAATDCGALGLLGLTTSELTELRRHPIIRRGRETQAAYARAAGR
jgi:hypothetical protein